MKPKIRPMHLTLFALLWLSACAEAQFAPTKMKQSYPYRTPPSAIELFRSSAPTKSYFEIGAVNACCSSDTNSMIELLRAKASENGGDALMGLDINAKGGASASVVRYK